MSYPVRGEVLLILLHSERPKLQRVLTVLSAVGLNSTLCDSSQLCHSVKVNTSMFCRIIGVSC